MMIPGFGASEVKKSSRLIDRTGMVFGRLTVLRRAPNSGQSVVWTCLCSCGNEVDILRSSLQYGNTKSCGCLKAEVAKVRMTRHGQARGYLYKAWQSMLQRCLNPKNQRYSNYGGRGIVVCPRWRESFEAFSSDVGERPTPAHSLDRIDVNGGYEPDNVRWATLREQAGNTTRAKRYLFNGEEMNVYEASRRYGTHKNTIEERLKRGVPPDAAVLPTREAFAAWKDGQ